MKYTFTIAEYKHTPTGQVLTRSLNLYAKDYTQEAYNASLEEAKGYYKRWSRRDLDHKYTVYLTVIDISKTVLANKEFNIISDSHL